MRFELTTYRLRGDCSTPELWWHKCYDKDKTKNLKSQFKYFYIMIIVVSEFIKQMHGWKFPIDLEVICNKMNIRTERIILPHYLEAFYSHNDRTIFVNSKLDRYNTRFVIAMEIRQAQSKEKINKKEKKEFALELLAPTEEFIKKWNENEPTQILGCSLYFDISPSKVILKFKSLNKKGLLSEKYFKSFSNLT